MATSLCRFLAFACAALLSPAALADDAPLDPAAFKEGLRIFQDGKGHFIAFKPTTDSTPLFFGDGKVMHQQRVRGFSANGSEQTAGAVFWEPRATAGYKSAFDISPAGGKLNCLDRMTDFTELPAEQATAFVASAKFMPAPFKRMAYALARDQTGVYYYVDRAREPEGNKNFHVFSGPRGKMKPLQLKNVVSDSQGDIFAAKNGELRLVLDRREASWHAGKSKPVALTLVPVEDNLPLIYSELGVYKEPLGTPCDLL